MSLVKTINMKTAIGIYLIQARRSDDKEISLVIKLQQVVEG